MIAVIPFDNEKEWRVVAQVITTAVFKRPSDPKRCNVKRFHVWRWEALKNDPNRQPIDGMKCECGGLTWTRRKLPPVPGVRP